MDVWMHEYASTVVWPSFQRSFLNDADCPSWWVLAIYLPVIGIVVFLLLAAPSNS